MPCKSLTKKDVSIHIEALPDDIPVRAILQRLEQGDVWAWASVAVTVSWENQEAIEYLGCCCYDDEEDFQRGGYMADMIDRALDSLNDDLRTLYDRLSV